MKEALVSYTKKLIAVTKDFEEIAEHNVRVRSEIEKVHKEFVSDAEEIVDAVRGILYDLADLIKHYEGKKCPRATERTETIAVQVDTTNIKSACEKTRNACLNVTRSIEKSAYPSEEKFRSPRRIHTCKHKIFILCDNYGRDLNTFMGEKLDNRKYFIQALIKPQAAFHQVIQYLPQLTKYYGIDDFIVIISGFNNFYRNKQMYESRDILKKVELCLNSNVIITTVPYMKPELNKFIHKFNETLKERACELNRDSLGEVSIVDVNKYNNKKMDTFELVNTITSRILHMSSKGMFY